MKDFKVKNANAIRDKQIELGLEIAPKTKDAPSKEDAPLQPDPSSTPEGAQSSMKNVAANLELTIPFTVPSPPKDASSDPAQEAPSLFFFVCYELFLLSLNFIIDVRILYKPCKF